MLDLGDAQQRGDDAERLVEAGDGLVGDSAQLVERLGMIAAALEPDPHPGERRAQIVRDVVADAGNLLDQRFDLAEHAVHADGELIERILGRRPPAAARANRRPRCAESCD